MSGSTPAAPASARSRRWRVPPPLTRNGELLEGSEVLTELTGETAVLLWKSLRSVTLWASASPQDQTRLFAPGSRSRRMAELLAAEIDPAIREPLEYLTRVLDEGSAHLSREAVALACRQIAAWAAGQSASATELSFVQAAALVCPADADLAFQVGRLTRARGEAARAESWYRRAVMLGRQTGNWTAYARSFVGLGILAKRRGNLPLARRSQSKALRSAERHGLHDIRALALHELFVVAVECEDASTAQRYAEGAYRAYGARHPNVRFLVHDLCCLWMREGQFSRALAVLQPLAPRFPENERLLISANLARAAGGAGDRDTFEQAWAEAGALLAAPQHRGTTTQALLNLARGATGVSEWERATQAAEQALAQASVAGEAQNMFEAESVLAFVRSRRAVEANVTHGSPSPKEVEADRFAEELVETFAGAAG